MTPRARLPAGERRAVVLDTATRVFARCSYRGATTAEIAREAGVSEPILYRHFASKQALYLACIDDAWSRVRAAWEEAVVAEPDPRVWTQAMASAFFLFREQRTAVATLWLQALTESGDDPEIRKYLRRHLREVHEFVADVLRRCQAAGAVPAERDVRAEAWIFIAVGLLVAVSARLGGLPADDVEGIRRSRRAWLAGEP
jgi:AcrR family transcriptional regulator